MVVGLATVELVIPGNGSLKGKRRVLKSLLSRLTREFNVSAAEIDDHDSWQRAVVGIATVSTTSGHAHGRLMHAIEAMENTPRDRRLLRIRTRLASAELVQVSVRDRGTGIAPDQEERVFNAFVSNKPDGMGMGLPISRTIIKDHGGQLWIERDVENGAELHFTLPVADTQT